MSGPVDCCCQVTAIVPQPVLYVAQWKCCWTEVPCQQSTTEGIQCALSKVWKCEWKALDCKKDADVYARFYPPSCCPGQPLPPQCSCNTGGCFDTKKGGLDPCGNTTSDCPPPPAQYWWLIPKPVYVIPEPEPGVCNACEPVLQTPIEKVWVPAVRKPCPMYVPQRPAFIVT